MKHSDAVASIKNLLELSKSPYKEESDTALIMAQKLADKFNISENDILDKPVIREFSIKDIRLYHLYYVIFRYFNCEPVLITGEYSRIEVKGIPYKINSAIMYAQNLKKKLEKNIINLKNLLKHKSIVGLEDLYYISFRTGMKQIIKYPPMEISYKTCNLTREMPAMDTESEDFISSKGISDGISFGRWMYENSNSSHRK